MPRRRRDDGLAPNPPRRRTPLAAASTAAARATETALGRHHNGFAPRRGRAPGRVSLQRGGDSGGPELGEGVPGPWAHNDELVARWQAGDRDVAGELLSANARLIQFVAVQIRRSCRSNWQSFRFDELMSLLAATTLTAASHWDRGRGVKFSTFLVPCLYRDGVTYLRKLTSEARRWAAFPQGDGDVTDYRDTLAAVERAEFLDVIRPLLFAVLRTLPRRQRAVIEHRFGLHGRPELTLQQLADRLKLSRQRIQQIEQKSLEILHRRLIQIYWRLPFATTTPENLKSCLP